MIFMEKETGNMYEVLTVTPETTGLLELIDGAYYATFRVSCITFSGEVRPLEPLTDESIENNFEFIGFI